MIEWLDEFYGDPDLRSTMLKNFLPVFSSYVAEATGGPVAASFVQALAESYVDRHLGSSRAQLQEVVKGADNPLADLQRRFDEWEEKRPGKVAANELVRSANAASVEKMREAGVTKMVWRASGGKTCPFCNELDGTIISVDGTFFEAGDELNPEGATAPIHFESSLGHPPVHQGCVCSVEAVAGDSQSQAIAEAEASIREHRDGEVSYVIGPDGETLLTKGREGKIAEDSYGVGFTADEMAQMKGGVLTHNHPDAWNYELSDPRSVASGFSQDDMLMAIDADLTEIRAVGRGATYSLQPGPDGWGDKYQAFGFSNIYDSNVRTEFQTMIWDNTAPASWGTEAAEQAFHASANHQHEVMVRLAEKMGWNYTRTLE